MQLPAPLLGLVPGLARVGVSVLAIPVQHDGGVVLTRPDASVIALYEVVQPVGRVRLYLYRLYAYPGSDRRTSARAACTGGTA